MLSIVSKILIFILVYLLTYNASLPNLDFYGSDIVNPYRYFQALGSGASFGDYIEIYDGRYYEIVLPIIIKIMSIFYPNLTLNEFAFTMSLLINETISLSLFFILLKKHFSISKQILLLIILGYIFLYPYGMVQQLSRQSLSIAILVLSLTFSNSIIKIILFIIGIITHISLLYTVLFLLFVNNFNNKMYFIYLCTPLILSIISKNILGYENEMFFHLDFNNYLNIFNFINHFDTRDYIFIVTLTVGLVISIFIKNDKARTLLKSLLIYYLIYFFYFLVDMQHFFQRYFLLCFILLNPILIIKIWLELLDKFIFKFLITILFISLIINNYMNALNY